VIGQPLPRLRVARGVEWLLGTTKPEDLPGLFGISEAWTQRYNTAKRSNQYFRPGRTSPGDATELAKYAEEVPTAPLSCRPWLTGSSAMAVEALFRLGVHEGPRARRALNTLAVIGRSRTSDSRRNPPDGSW